MLGLFCLKVNVRMFRILLFYVMSRICISYYVIMFYHTPAISVYVRGITTACKSLYTYAVTLYGVYLQLPKSLNCTSVTSPRQS